MRSILVVDDDRETCRFITELIGDDHRHITTEQDPARALNLLRREHFDLMVSDINLNAAVSGLDLLKAFKDENPAGQVLTATLPAIAELSSATISATRTSTSASSPAWSARPTPGAVPAWPRTSRRCDRWWSSGCPSTRSWWCRSPPRAPSA